MVCRLLYFVHVHSSIILVGWCCFWRYLWSRARKDFVVIRLYFGQAETSYRSWLVVLRLGYEESPLGRIARSRLTLQLMSWNQKREPQSIVVIDLTTKIKRIAEQKTLKNLENSILHEVKMRNVFKCILTESSCGYSSFLPGNDIFRNGIGNIHHLFHLCTHQKQKFRNDELYQPSFASAPGARCCVKKLKWWQYLMP